MFIVLVNDNEGILNEFVLMTADRAKAESKFLATCSHRLQGAEYSDEEKDIILDNGYSKVGDGGVVMFIDTDGPTSDAEIRDELTGQPSGDMKIAEIAQEGELDLTVGMDVDAILEQCGRHLDSACSWDIIGQILIKGDDGKWYTITTESIIGLANPEWVKETLDERKEIAEDQEIIFTCPKCNGHKIIETMIVSSEIDSLDAEGKVDSGEHTNEDGEVDRYECGGCGFVIVSHDFEFDEFTQDGLDGGALVKAIDALNSKEKPTDNELATHGELVSQMSEAYEAMTGEELTEIWNEMFPSQPVVYEGDSLYSRKTA